MSRPQNSGGAVSSTSSLGGSTSRPPPHLGSSVRGNHSSSAHRGNPHRAAQQQGGNAQLLVQPVELRPCGRQGGLSPVTEASDTENETLLDNDNGGRQKSRYNSASAVPRLIFEPPDSPTSSIVSEKHSPDTADQDDKSERSDLLSPPSPTFSGRSRDHSSTSSKWGQLRTTIRMATAMQGKKNRKASSLMRQDSFLKRFSTRHGGVASTDEESDEDNRAPTWEETKRQENKRDGRFVINPDENFMFYWLGIITIAVLYNLWTGIAREAFPEIQEGYEVMWFILDAFSDLIYISDIMVQLRTGYLEKGLIVYDTKKLANHYLSSKYFTFDCICLLPLDFLQFQIGIHPILRFPRYFKIYRSYRFSYMVETRTVFPNTWRVVNLSHVLFLGSHWFAGFYFMISKAEGYYGAWGYPEPVGEFASVTRKYLKSLYWSTLTLTTIGDLPPPETNWEYVFTILSYLIGVFVFATIVGQVGSVITNRNASRQEFERLLDAAKAYMRSHNVPQDMQRRVQRWYDYAWSRGRMNGGGDINSLGLLPDKLKTELAIHVNLETLKKVTIFQECSPEFLHDLVLKMKAFIFTPGDLICRKGEIAREMFIIADGLLEVISETGEVLTQMGAGDFFGEIGILNLDGGVNRRTADVRSVGYSELFVLSRQDVLSALKDHPEAEELITAYGHKRLQEIMDHQRKRHMQKMAKKSGNQNSAETSPVHRMINSSSTLLSQVAKIGISASRSDDNLYVHKRKHTVITEEEEDALSTQESPLETCDLLKRVIQLGRQEASQAEGKKPNNLCATMSLPLNSVQDKDNIPDDNLNIPVHNNNGDPLKKTKLNSKWGIALCGRGDKQQVPARKMTNYNGNKYEAISDDDDDAQQEDAIKVDISSPDYVTVVMETEESDLDNTMTPDDHCRSTPLTPDLVQFAKPVAYRTLSLQSSTSTCSEPNSNMNLNGGDYLSVPQVDQAEPEYTAPELPPEKDQPDKSSGDKFHISRMGKPDPWKPRTKSVSFDNPSYSLSRSNSPVYEGLRLRRTLSDNDLAQPAFQASHAHDLDLDPSLDLQIAPCSPRSRELHPSVGSNGTPNSSSSSAKDTQIELQPLKPQTSNGNKSHTSAEGQISNPTSTSRRLSFDTEETSIMDSMEEKLVDISSPGISNPSGQDNSGAVHCQSSDSSETSSSSGLFPSHANGDRISSPSQAQADHIPSSNPSSHTRTGVTETNLDSPLSRTPSDQGSRANGGHSLDNDDTTFDDVVTSLKNVLERKMTSCQQQYEHHIQQLQTDNVEKQERIKQLEMQLSSLQDIVMLNEDLFCSDTEYSGNDIQFLDV